MALRIIYVHTLGDEERRLLTRLVNLLEKEDVDPAQVAEVSVESDKLEREAKDIRDKLNKQPKPGGG